MNLTDSNFKIANHIGVSAYNIKDFAYSNLICDFITKESNIYSKKTQIQVTIGEFSTYVSKNYSENEWQTIQTAYNGGLLIYKQSKMFIEYVSSDNETYISVFGDKDFTDKHIEQFLQDFPQGVSIQWYYSPQESPSTVYIDMEKLPVDEMYPNIKKPLEEYYSDFIHSSANILILIGPPGTGKTSWLRGLISHYDGAKPFVTYDPALLQTDGFFNTFVTGDSNLLIVEDADNFLSPRSDGNDIITRFLNIGDGLISTKGKKIIFSTNLPSIKDIDSAMLRPGRCYDVLHFDPLTREQVEKLSKKISGISIPNDGKDAWMLAELFHTVSGQVNKKFGFL